MQTRLLINLLIPVCAFSTACQGTPNEASSIHRLSIPAHVQPAQGGTLASLSRADTSNTIVATSPTTSSISVIDFGAVPDAVGTADFTSIFSGTDDTQAFQSAIDQAIKTGATLIIPSGRYLITKTVTIEGTLDIEASPDSIILGKIYDKTKPVFDVIGDNRGRISNLQVYGAGYLPLAGFQFSSQDSQGMELDNVKVVQCRNGIYVDEPEVINRIVFNRCYFGSNLIAGAWIKSYDSTYGQSGPITFLYTICHSNGIPAFMSNATSYQGIGVLNPTDKWGTQLYCRGFVNLSYVGGQLSAAGDPGILSLASFENGSGLSFLSTDFEGITRPVKLDGTPITDLAQGYADSEAAALNIESVQGVKVAQSHTYQIDTQSFLKLSYDCGDVGVEQVDLTGTAPYLIYAEGTNGSSGNTLRLTADVPLTELNALALASLNSNQMVTLFQAQSDTLQPDAGLNWAFDHVYGIDRANNVYQIGYRGSNLNSPDLSKACYVERGVAGYGGVYYQLSCTQDSFTPDGKFFIEALSPAGTILGVHYDETSGTDQFGNSYSRYGVYSLPSGSDKIRAGFINSADYDGRIPDNATVNGFTLKGLIQNPSEAGIATDSDVASQALANNITFGSAPPVNGSYSAGNIVLNSNPSPGAPLGWTCTTSGTPGTWSILGLVDPTSSFSQTLDFPLIAAGAEAALTIAAPGVQIGDSIILVPPATLEDGLIATGLVTSPGTITVRLGNFTPAGINPAPATWKATIVR